MKKEKVAIWWLRRDMRIADNAALFKASKATSKVLPVFIFDRAILDKLESKDVRVAFIHQELSNLKATLEAQGSTLVTHYGNPQEAFEHLSSTYDIDTVYLSRDYEPYALQRDKDIAKFLESKGIKMVGAKDHVIFEKDEVLKDDGKPYTVFTPYSKKWLLRLEKEPISTYQYDISTLFLKSQPASMPSLKEMGFEDVSASFPTTEIDDSILTQYENRRDIPAVRGTSRLSIHLRFGTVSVRTLVMRAQELGATKWLTELIWRDFYQCILYHFPHTVDQSFKPAYDRIPWRNDEAEFEKWCRGTTGFPLVDAGMRELNATGFMHNRVRMLVASFLTKHLLIDWRWGERYFAEKLLDFDLASNIGGWQWASGSGCDAAPYFRVFSPASQQEKFDPNYTYVKKWVAEWGTNAYPKPMVDHAMARQRAIDTYKAALA
ncbi:MAG: DNA photolyase family protein [Flavobacteriales bacterium]|nr:DNA photolyase family protein [Flavobacteriales bacterium]